MRQWRMRQRGRSRPKDEGRKVESEAFSVNEGVNLPIQRVKPRHEDAKESNEKD